MKIRPANKNDHKHIWNIFSSVIKTGDTYVFSPDTPRQDLKKHWFASYMHTFVAEENDKIVGTYIIKPNQIDLGSHIANCSYMVHPDHQGKGTGSLMCAHSIEQGKILGFHAIQFNLVISTNLPAIHLWEKHGFETIATVPEAFNHFGKGELVDGLVMYRKL